MLGILNVQTQAPKLYEIHTALEAGDLSEAEDLLLQYLTHPNTYDTLQKAFGNCVGIIRFVRSVSFSTRITTAVCNIVTGKIRLSVDFFKKHINSNTDLLSVLLHERNHYLIRKMKFADLKNLRGTELNILEDAYINGPIYKMLRPKLLETYYQDEDGLSTMLNHKSQKFKEWMKTIGFRESTSHSLYQMHRQLYSPESPTATVEYRTWMILGRELAVYLRTLQPPPSDEPEEEEEEEEDKKEEGSSGEKVGEGTGHTKDTQPTDVTFEEMEPDYKNGPTLEDIQQTVAEAIQVEILGDNGKYEPPQVGTFHDFPGRPDDWTLIAENNFSVPLHAVLVPTVNLDGLVGQLLQESWDSSLSSIFRSSEGSLTNINRKLNRVAELIGSVMSQPSMHDTGLIGRSAYPYQIHRRDIVMLGAGQIPTSWGVYLTHEEEKIPLYVDVSYSMISWYLFLPWIIQHLKHYVGEVYHFSSIPMERHLDTQILLTMGGTNFEAVASHILTKQYKRAVILTDNEDTLEKKTKEKLKDSGVQIYLLCTSKRNRGDKYDTDEGGWRPVVTSETSLVSLKKD